jgi:hypothetical protein
MQTWEQEIAARSNRMIGEIGTLLKRGGGATQFVFTRGLSTYVLTLELHEVDEAIMARPKPKSRGARREKR